MSYNYCPFVYFSSLIVWKCFIQRYWTDDYKGGANGALVKFEVHHVICWLLHFMFNLSRVEYWKHIFGGHLALFVRVFFLLFFVVVVLLRNGWKMVLPEKKITTVIRAKICNDYLRLIPWKVEHNGCLLEERRDLEFTY